MLKQFYEKALPSQGVYCITSIGTDKKVTNKFAETLDGVFEQIEKFKAKQLNVFVALGTFDGFSRKADDCIFVRSFFIDLDVGESKEYASKADAHTALYKLVGAAGLPDPVVIDSGGGVHAYWIMDEDIPKDEWKPYAEKFKALCQQHIAIDPVVTADAARIMRAPETFNHKFDPPVPTSVINDEIYVYSWPEFRAFLGGEESVQQPVQERSEESQSILDSIPKGLDEDTQSILKLDNFAKSFESLAQKSVDNEGGCGQIKYALENAANLEEPMWHAVISIAKFCDDGAIAIHELSNPDPRYTHEETEKVAKRAPAPRTCEWFIGDYPSRCDGCQHKGKITSPIQLARVFKAAPTPDKTDAVWEASDTEAVSAFPQFLYPFVKGENGGVYFVPPAKVDKKGMKIQDDPILILSCDLYPIKRMVSPHDGECLEMRLELPLDGPRTFLLPMKHVYAKESLKAIMASNGVFFTSHNDQYLMNYIIKWGQYLQTTNAALQMRMQMGWTHQRTDPDWNKRSFVIGKKEITITGETIEAPSSPFVKGLSRHLTTHGTFNRWRESMDYLNKPGFELHAFASMSGFGSTLMPYTSTSGVVMSLTGLSGNAKTGAMYAGLSVFGHPKDLSVVEATDNGLTGRYLGLHNMMFGLDEVGDMKAEEIGKLVHNVSHGKAKIRMQASVNAEREYEMAASLIAVLTSNHGLYGILEGLKLNPTGEAARLVEFQVHRPQILNEQPRLGEYIFDAFKYNYGHAGPMFVKALLLKGDNYILDNIEKWREKFNKDFGAFPEYRFYQNLVGANFGAASIANEHEITAYELDRIYHKVVLSMIEIKDKVVKVNAVDYPSLLGDFMNKYHGSILSLKDGKISNEPKNQIVARVVSDEDLLQVSKTEFKKFLAERKVSTREFEFDMRERKILIDDKKGRLTTGWKNAISVDSTYLYWFRTPIPAEWLANDSEST
jgi:hypothetical protein